MTNRNSRHRRKQKRKYVSDNPVRRFRSLRRLQEDDETKAMKAKMKEDAAALKAAQARWVKRL